MLFIGEVLEANEFRHILYLGESWDSFVVFVIMGMSLHSY